MDVSESNAKKQAGTAGGTARHSSLSRAAAVAAGALLLAWPAIYNHYPLLYPDSITYLADGRSVARALFLHRLSEYYGMRSLIYSLGILPFHWNVSPWPVVALHAGLAAWILWLVVRSIFPRRTVVTYLMVVPLLSLLSSVSWFVSLILPDILGPLLYLSLYLLVFARETLTGRERVGAACFAGWAMTAHLTHLALAAGVCMLLALLWLAHSPLLTGRGRALAGAALVVIVAGGAQVALHAYLYGNASLEGDAPPFLAARVIADGPGRWYLEQHCPQAGLALCESVDELPADTDEFLWKRGGIWPAAAADGDDRIRQQELKFVLAVLRAFPRQQLAISAGHFRQQLGAFGLYDLDRNNWVLEAFDTALPGDKSNYLKSWQFNDALPLEGFSTAEYWTVVVSLAVIVLVPLLLRGRLPHPLQGLTVIALPAVAANALITGVFSNVEERYQARVVWLLPLLAVLYSLCWLERRRGRARDSLQAAPS